MRMLCPFPQANKQLASGRLFDGGSRWQSSFIGRTTDCMSFVKNGYAPRNCFKFQLRSSNSHSKVCKPAFSYVFPNAMFCGRVQFDGALASFRLCACPRFQVVIALPTRICQTAPHKQCPRDSKQKLGCASCSTMRPADTSGQWQPTPPPEQSRRCAKE